MSSSIDSLLNDSKPIRPFVDSVEFALLLKDYKIVFNKCPHSASNTITQTVDSAAAMAPPSTTTSKQVADNNCTDTASTENRLPRRLHDNLHQSSSVIDDSDLSQATSTMISLIRESDDDDTAPERRHRNSRNSRTHHHHHLLLHRKGLPKIRPTVPKPVPCYPALQQKTSTRATTTATNSARSPSDSASSLASSDQSQSERSMRCSLLRKQLELVELQLRNERRLCSEEVAATAQETTQRKHRKDC